MAEYAISTNLISWAPAKAGLFGWPQDGPESEVVEAMRPGDLLVPKFSQTPDYRRDGGSQSDYVKAICDVLGRDYTEEYTDYEDRVAGGLGAVPFVWRVTGILPLDGRFPGTPWSVVEIEQSEFSWPFSTSEFLRLRAIPIEIARQFKATAAQGRHIQLLPSGTVRSLKLDGNEHNRQSSMRNMLLVRAGSGPEALREVVRGGTTPRVGDYLFLVQDELMPGFFEVKDGGGDGMVAERVGQGVALSAEVLVDLINRAIQRARPSDQFKPGNARRAAQQLWEFTELGDPTMEIDEFATFYDRYVNLPKKVSQALEIADRTDASDSVPIGSDEEGEEEEEDSEELERDSLHGLTVSTVESNLVGLDLPPKVLAEAVTAIRAGKHLLLSGPPGTGKSTVAAALCRSVVGEEFETATATADWTTFDTIGGYMPRDGGHLEFEPGIVLRCLERGRWLVIDELNRADIDKAFGPLFTLLAGSGEGGGGEDVTLPFRKSEKNIRLVWADRRDEASSPYALTPTWRLLGTLNVRDKATLFQLSFAFLRRFAVIDIPLPDEATYRALFEQWAGKVDAAEREQLVDAAMKVAFGPRPLGPAILKDIAAFVEIGRTATETESVSAPYGDAVEAFLTALRLYGAPQYEGAVGGEVDDLLQRLRGIWPEPPGSAWSALEGALEGVSLS